MIKTSITSTVTSDIGISVKKKDGSALSTAIKKAAQINTAAKINSKFGAKIKQAMIVMTKDIENEIIRNLGAGRISPTAGKFYKEKVIKLDQVVDTQETTNESFKSDTLSFTDSMLAAGNNQTALFKLLSGPSKSAAIFRAYIVSNTNSIELPKQLRGRLQISSINFTFKDLNKLAIGKKGKLLVTKIGTGIHVSFSINASTISKLIYRIDAIILKHVRGSLGSVVTEASATQMTLASSNSVAEVNKFLSSLGFSYSVRYSSSSGTGANLFKGSALESKRASNNQTSQQFISGAQLTALVQKRLAATMGRGVPNPPWLKERSGRFKDSVTIRPNYKTQTIHFDYMPLYDNNITYGYDVPKQVRQATREVVQMLFSRKFNIIRE